MDSVPRALPPSSTCPAITFTSPSTSAVDCGHRQCRRASSAGGRHRKITPPLRPRRATSTPACWPAASPADSNRSPRKRNRSLGAPARKFRILKIHRAETRPGNLDLRGEVSDIPRQRPDSWPLTSGNVGTSASTRNSYAETIVAGWAERIRTALCRIQTCLSNGRTRTANKRLWAQQLRRLSTLPPATSPLRSFVMPRS